MVGVGNLLPLDRRSAKILSKPLPAFSTYLIERKTSIILGRGRHLSCCQTWSPPRTCQCRRRPFRCNRFEGRWKRAWVVQEWVHSAPSGRQSAPNLYDFFAAQIGQVARCVHHPCMNAAEHIAERLLYLVVREHPAMFGAESREDFSECHHWESLSCKDGGLKNRLKIYWTKFLALKLG